MHASAPYLYHKRTIPTLEDTCTQMRMYLKNKGASLAGLFILKQIFMSLAANILSAAKFHKLLKAGVPVLSVMKTNLQALPSFKGLPTRRYSFVHTYSCKMTFSSCWNKVSFAIPVQTLELAARTSRCPWQAPAEAGPPHQTQLLQFGVQAPALFPCLSSSPWNHFNIMDRQKINLADRPAFRWV